MTTLSPHSILADSCDGEVGASSYRGALPSLTHRSTYNSYVLLFCIIQRSNETPSI